MPRFTEPVVKGLIERARIPAGKKDIIITDDAMPGFFLRIFSTGAAFYGCRFRVGRQARRMTLGPWTDGGLKAARKAAAAAMNGAKLGQDAAAEKKARARQRTTMGDLVPDYLRARRPQAGAAAPGTDDQRRRASLKPRTYAEVKRYLESKRYWQPLHKLPIEDIGAEDIVKRLNAIEAANGASSADVARRYLSGFFAWCLDRMHVKANPVLGMRSRAGKGGRERTLSEAELAEVWQACPDDDFGRIVKLLILTGQRRSEIADLCWSEVNQAERQIDLPPTRTKNNRPHVVPLSKEALAVLSSGTHWAGRDLVFGVGERRGFNGWSKAKRALDKTIAEARGPDDPMPPWTLHDLRRTFVTLCGERGIAEPHVIEAIVNHISGLKGGVAGVYNRALYLEERRKALKAWGAYVARLSTENLPSE